MCVCRECAQAVLPPALSRPMYNVHVHQHQCTSPQLPPPSNHKAERAPTGEWVGSSTPATTAPDTPPPPVMDHRPSEQHQGVQEEKKYRSIREYILRIQNCGEIQSNSWGLEKYNWLVACPKTGHSTSPMSQNLPDWKEITPLNKSTCTLSDRWLVNSAIECLCQQRVASGLKTNCTLLDD